MICTVSIEKKYCNLWMKWYTEVKTYTIVFAMNRGIHCWVSVYLDTEKNRHIQVNEIRVLVYASSHPHEENFRSQKQPVYEK